MKQPPYNENLSDTDRTSVLISEASKMYCDLLNMAFSAVRERFNVVASASSAAEILTVIQEQRTQGGVISDNLADAPLAGIRILPEVRRINPDTRILVAMGSPDPELVIEGFRFGGGGVFWRTTCFEAL